MQMEGKRNEVRSDGPSFRQAQGKLHLWDRDEEKGDLVRRVFGILFNDNEQKHFKPFNHSKQF